MRYVSLFSAIPLTAAAYLFGHVDSGIILLGLAIGIDFITGIFSGVFQKIISSQTMFNGLLKKATIMLIIILSVALDRFLEVNNIFRTITIYFYVVNEILSIIENLAILGVPFPTGFLKILERFNPLNKD